MTKLSQNAPVRRVIVELEHKFYPNAIAAEIRRLLQHQFGWRTTSKIDKRVMTVKQWHKEAPDEPDASSLEPIKPISRTLVRDLIEALTEYVPSDQTVREYVARMEEAPCHYPRVSAFACERCSKDINAIRALQLARDHGLLE